ncbi:hypothetical protein [uncultured Bacteroides sp.]|uniref:hypothetical protein n=1 Tax=uncultured Bacteroides sp. TaxID=162156 RepID=UPI002AA7241C|nr:hypothetical protein [uncultured Bacteroides sp.]
MRRFILSIALCLASISLFSQTYRLESLFEDKVSETRLSYWNMLDDPQPSKVDTFSLWGYKRYTDSWEYAYEVEYFKGDPEQTFNFLTKVADFAEKYQNEDKIQTRISGMKVRTMKRGMFKYTFVYDKYERDCCPFAAKHWNEMRDKFVEFCKQMNIKYQEE